MWTTSESGEYLNFFPQIRMIVRKKYLNVCAFVSIIEEICKKAIFQCESSLVIVHPLITNN